MRKLISLFIAVFAVFALPVTAYAGTISVSGAGEVLVPADIAIVSLGVNARDKDVLSAQETVNSAIADVRDALLEAGVAQEDINTGYINLYAVYDYDGDQEQVVAYNADSTLAIRVTDMEKVGEVIDTAFHAGANTLDGISFSASDIKDASADALREAVSDAKVKAEVLAEASGLEISGIESITENNTYSYDGGLRNNFSVKNEVGSDTATPTYVQAAKLTVSATVTITYNTAE